MADTNTVRIRSKTQAKQHSRRSYDLKLAAKILYPLALLHLDGTPLEEVQSGDVGAGWPGFSSRVECKTFFSHDPNAAWEIILDLAKLTDDDPLKYLSWFSRRHEKPIVWLEDLYYVAALAVLQWLADNYTFYNPNQEASDAGV